MVAASATMDPAWNRADRRDIGMADNVTVPQVNRKPRPASTSGRYNTKHQFDPFPRETRRSLCR